jgi:hypothetical protein
MKREFLSFLFTRISLEKKYLIGRHREQMSGLLLWKVILVPLISTFLTNTMLLDSSKDNTLIVEEVNGGSGNVERGI